MTLRRKSIVELAGAETANKLSIEGATLINFTLKPELPELF